MKGYSVGFISGVCATLIIAVLSMNHISTKLVDDSFAKQSVSSDIENLDIRPSSTVFKNFTVAQTVPPDDFLIKVVSTSDELLNAVSDANKNGGKTAIYLQDGEYPLKKSILVNADDIMFLSVSANPYKATLKGLGMKRTSEVNNIFKVRASGFVLDGIRLTSSPNHLIQIAAENKASRPVIRNCILQDSFEQLVKVSYDQLSRSQNFSYDGIVEHCIFQYTQGIAPYFYTGGIDALGAKRWRVSDNLFKDIASPGKQIAQHAVHFWVNASDNTVSNNIFIDNDRAIGFGMRQKKRINDSLDYFSKGGLIDSNLIYHSKNGDPFGDTGIILESSPESIVKGNYIYMEHSYPRAIEFRFEETQNVIIENNLSNKAIRARNGGSAVLRNNQQNLDEMEFFERLEVAMQAQQIVSLDFPLQDAFRYD